MDGGLILLLGVIGWVIAIFMTCAFLAVCKSEPPVQVVRRGVEAEGRVRVLHAPEPGRTMIGPERLHCRSCLVLWPCQTIRALDEPTNPATHIGRGYTGRPIGEPPNPSEAHSRSAQ